MDLHTSDPVLRGTALEYLEGVLPPDIRDRLWPFLGDSPAPLPATGAVARRDPGGSAAIERIDRAESRGTAPTRSRPGERFVVTFDRNDGGRHKVIARRHDTDADRHLPTLAGSTGRIPEELVSDQVRRLAVFAATAGAVWSFGLFMDLIVLPAAGLPDTPNWRNISIEIYACLTALALWAYLRVSAAAHHVKMNAGFVFMVVNALAIALLNAWALPPVGIPDPPAVVGDDSDPRLLDDRAQHPAAHARGLSRGRVDGSALLLDRLPARPAGAELHDRRSSSAGRTTPAPSSPCCPRALLQRIGRRLREAQELGSYHLVELLGRGGMGEVWRAEHRLLARQAAVKLVRPKCWAPATTPRPGSCCGASSARRRPPRR